MSLHHSRIAIGLTGLAIGCFGLIVGQAAFGNDQIRPQGVTVSQILSDGHVTDAEQHQAVVNMIGCLRNAGHRTSDPIPVRGANYWSYSVGAGKTSKEIAAAERAITECNERELAPVMELHMAGDQARTQTPEQRKAAAKTYVDCLAQQGLADDSSPEVTRAKDAPSIANLKALQDAAIARDGGHQASNCLVDAGLAISVTYSMPDEALEAGVGIGSPG